MRRFGVLLLLIVAAFAVYTYWKVTRLQEEVAELKATVARRQVVAAPSKDARALLNEATEGIKRARAALDRGQTMRAKRELDVSLRRLEEVSKMARERNGNGELTEAWKELRGQMDKLWKQFQESKRK